MTPKNRTSEGKNRTFGGYGGSKIVKNHRTSLMDDPLRLSSVPTALNNVAKLARQKLSSAVLFSSGIDF